jgi:CRP/FNR family cyclic AMP-dependent transcriptional regulator
VDNDVLRQAPLFSALDDEAATALRSSMAESRLRRGEVLFHEGDSGDKLYIVLDGKVKLGRTSSDGRENLLAIPARCSASSPCSTRARARRR